MLNALCSVKMPAQFLVLNSSSKGLLIERAIVVAWLCRRVGRRIVSLCRVCIVAATVAVAALLDLAQPA